MKRELDDMTEEELNLLGSTLAGRTGDITKAEDEREKEQTETPKKRPTDARKAYKSKTASYENSKIQDAKRSHWMHEKPKKFISRYNTRQEQRATGGTSNESNKQR